jgi:hypothetical protein
MFMRYTHFGVGHSPMLRKIIRDCLGSVSVALADPMDNATEGNGDNADREEAGDGEGHEYNNDEEESDDDDGYEVLGDGELDEGAMAQDDDRDGYDGDDWQSDHDDDLSF